MTLREELDAAWAESAFSKLADLRSYGDELRESFESGFVAGQIAMLDKYTKSVFSASERPATGSTP